jgi:hypothetical protein
VVGTVIGLRGNFVDTDFCGKMLVDIRDGKVYNLVRRGIGLRGENK